MSLVNRFILKLEKFKKFLDDDEHSKELFFVILVIIALALTFWVATGLASGQFIPNFIGGSPNEI